MPLGLRRFFELVLCGIGCNNVMPGRLGDFLRARWLGHATGISGGRALATVVLDRWPISNNTVCTASRRLRRSIDSSLVIEPHDNAQGKYYQDKGRQRQQHRAAAAKFERPPVDRRMCSRPQSIKMAA